MARAPRRYSWTTVSQVPNNGAGGAATGANGNNNDAWIQQYQAMMQASANSNKELAAGNNAAQLAMMREQAGFAQNLAKQQANDWLNVQSQLMAESSKYRSKESTQQYSQDLSMQQDNQGHQKRMLLEQEGVDSRAQARSNNMAYEAYKKL